MTHEKGLVPSESFSEDRPHTAPRYPTDRLYVSGQLRIAILREFLRYCVNSLKPHLYVRQFAGDRWNKLSTLSMKHLYVTAHLRQNLKHHYSVMTTLQGSVFGVHAQLNLFHKPRKQHDSSPYHNRKSGNCYLSARLLHKL